MVGMDSEEDPVTEGVEELDELEMLVSADVEDGRGVGVADCSEEVST